MYLLGLDGLNDHLQTFSTVRIDNGNVDPPNDPTEDHLNTAVHVSVHPFLNPVNDLQMDAVCEETPPCDKVLRSP